MDPVRPKILNRPQRKSSCCTFESADDQYRREQDLLAAKSRRLQTAEERLLNSLYPTKEHVRARQHEILLMQEQCMSARQEAVQREQQLEREISQKAKEKCEQAQAGNIRPWTIATLAFASADAEREARKQFAATVAAENLTLMAQRAAQRQQQYREQQQQEQQAVSSESEYWNLGASNRRWIAPEYRHLAPSSPKTTHPTSSTAAAASVTPPWALHTEDLNNSSSLSRRSSTASTMGSGWNAGRPHSAGSYEQHSQRKRVQHMRATQLQSVKYPWEWRG